MSIKIHIPRNISVLISKMMLLSFLLLTLRCSKPIDLEVDRTAIIVVDGKVATEPGASRVIMYGIDQDGIQIPLSGYVVSIVSSDGTENSFLEHENSGEYRPDGGFVGEIDESYYLLAVSPTGQTLVSDVEVIQEPMPFELSILDTTRFISEAPGIVTQKEGRAAVVSFDPSNKPAYYARFTFRYEYVHSINLSQIIEQTEDAFRLFSCLDNDMCTSSPSTLVIEVVDRKNWTFIDCVDPPVPCSLPCCEFFEDYGTEFIVTQESYSESTIRFWEEVELLLENDGLVFDTYPFPVTGNVRCDDCDLEVFGYFSAVGMNQAKALVTL